MNQAALALVFLIIAIGSASGNDLFVNPEAGNDQDLGAADSPVATIQHAVSLSEPGDTIHLLPQNAIYRQNVVLSNVTDLTIEGNGVTLDGADPLPIDGWEQVASRLHRRRLPRTTWDRHLLIVDGHTERMGRTQSSNSPNFPAASDLTAGQFCVENIDDKQCWLYVCGSLDKLEWATRPNGIGTGGETANITVRNVNARHFLNDGFNIHGHSVSMKFHGVTGYDCFDEGFSAHDTSSCEIEDSRFWGNENAIADVNDCETHYRRCEFRDSVNFDVLLVGKRHSLTDCTINNTASATALAAGPRGDADKLFQLELTRLQLFCERPDAKARVRIDGGNIIMRQCNLTNSELNTAGATVENLD